MRRLEYPNLALAFPSAKSKEHITKPSSILFVILFLMSTYSEEERTDFHFHLCAVFEVDLH